MKHSDDMKNKNRKILLTGVTASGSLHIGNYIGAIKPMVDLLHNYKAESYCFIADYHSLIKLHNPSLRKKYIYDTAAAWLAFGLDPKKTTFYRQSSIPEILELNWILNSVTNKGLLNRAHAYKDAINKNYVKNKTTIDHGLHMGLYNYPMLMAADIILFGANIIPVGKDQMQHIEITRAIIHRFNNMYDPNILQAPQAFIKNAVIIPGTDGKKMSKSHGNVIDIFSQNHLLRKNIMKITTNSQLENEPKSATGCVLFSLYQSFSSSTDTSKFLEFYNAGISWKEAKEILFERIEKTLSHARKKYEYYRANPRIIESYLELGGLKARKKAQHTLNKIKSSIGL